MDVADLEQLAVSTYQRFGFDAARPLSPVVLARALLDDQDPIELVSWLATGHGALYRLRGRRRIAIRKSLPIEYQLFALAHELSHVLLEECDHSSPRIESSCDYLAACLLSPAPATHALHAALRFDLKTIAQLTCSTQTWAALRLGEVLRVAVAAIRPSKIRYRGAQSDLAAFPSERTLRAVVRGKARDDRLRVVMISDARGRAAVLGGANFERRTTFFVG